MTAKTRVVVAMSGGVDSSLTAALLLRQGYDVIGVTMQIWPAEAPPDDAAARGCCSLAAVDDARRVADRLGIPYYVLNFRDLFKEKVIDYFCGEYGRGRTPNPCIACNHHVKFTALLHKAQQLGAAYLATGHYARIQHAGGRYLLYKGRDRKKDQSYALYNLTQYQLARVLFPLGEYTKEETRAMAREWGLPVAEKPDSQEICFVPDDDYKAFLAERIPATIRPGPFVDVTGQVLGTHQGLPFYTVGQRKGLGIATGAPMYVVGLDPEKNAVILGRDKDVYGRALLAEEVNFIPFDRLTEPLAVEAKIRYGAPQAPADILPAEEGRVLVRFRRSQRAITPGQAVVFYQGDLVMGGGVISRQVE